MTAYRIHTERLVLRCWSPQDAPLLQQAIDRNLEHLRPWMPWALQEPEPTEQKASRLRGFRADFEAGREFHYGVFDRDESRVVGGVGLHPRIGAGAAEIGYWIHVDHGGQGFATEAAAALVRTGFEQQRLARIEIHCDPANIACCGIPRRLGFLHQVTNAGCVKGPVAEPRDNMVWALERPAFDASPAAASAFEAFDADGKGLNRASRSCLTAAKGGCTAGSWPV